MYFYLIFAWVFRTSWLKMRVLGGKIGEGVVRFGPPTNSFLLFGVIIIIIERKDLGGVMSKDCKDTLQTLQTVTKRECDAK